MCRGLKVVCPSNPADAYGLLRAAIDDPDPVIVVENKAPVCLQGRAARHAGAGAHRPGCHRPLR